ncbi:hypothetical protein BpHYR1_010205 [Brachionus plicatilis]|uniref:Uncharacterized protein n=1 Tax=Brachionus plicatilis TaxID=10195 RepID=A0A3M7R0E4_BRAPC|nr:hypothetical protein BpHYR1_010205 [Brachionus plicatilis]
MTDIKKSTTEINKNADRKSADFLTRKKPSGVVYNLSRPILFFEVGAESEVAVNNYNIFKKSKRVASLIDYYY